ncbi:hypothetical protein CLOP_g4450 [Closterium sp. NIES-67]|nr:hypothetical protein CLOP_g4450 [Closterium sp. NIES-67]
MPSSRAKLGKKVLWSLEEETSYIKDLWQLPIIPWNGKTPTAATAAAANATAGGDATAPTDGVLEAIKKVQQQQTHGEVLAGVDILRRSFRRNENLFNRSKNAKAMKIQSS